MESLLKFTKVFGMLKLGKNYQVKFEIAGSERNCQKSWVHIYFPRVFFFYTSRREDSQKYLKENASSMPVQFSWSKNIASFPWSWRVVWGALVESFWKSFTLKRLKGAVGDIDSVMCAEKFCLLQFARHWQICTQFVTSFMTNSVTKFDRYPIWW